MTKLVKIRYLDHVEFRNLDSREVKPVVRETVGWLVHEDSNYVVVIWDRPALRDRSMRSRESGLALLKSDIIEMKVVETEA